MPDSTFKDNIYGDYVKKGFKGTKEEFSTLLTKPEFISSIYNDYTKLGFKGNLTDFSNLVNKPVSNKPTEKTFSDKLFESLPFELQAFNPSNFKDNKSSLDYIFGKDDKNRKPDDSSITISPLEGNSFETSKYNIASLKTIGKINPSSEDLDNPYIMESIMKNKKAVDKELSNTIEEFKTTNNPKVLSDYIDKKIKPLYNSENINVKKDLLKKQRYGNWELGESKNYNLDELAYKAGQLPQRLAESFENLSFGNQEYTAQKNKELETINSQLALEDRHPGAYPKEVVENLKLQRDSLVKDLKDKNIQTEKDLEDLVSTESNFLNFVKGIFEYTNSTAKKTRTSPSQLTKLPDGDLLLELSKIGATTSSIQSPELLDAKLLKYKTSFDGFTLADVLQGNTPSTKGYFSAIAQEDRISFQDETYKGLQSLKDNVTYNMESLPKEIKSLEATFSKMDGNSRITINNNSYTKEQLGSVIASKKSILSENEVLMGRLNGLQYSYFTDYKDVSDKKKALTKEAQMYLKDDFNIKNLNDAGVAVTANTYKLRNTLYNVSAGAASALTDYMDYGLYKSGFISKEQYILNKLGVSDINSSGFLYVPEPIKNRKAFEIHEGEDGKYDYKVKWDAVIEEGISTFIESMALAYTGQGIGSKLFPFLSNRLATGLGGVITSNFLISDIDKENFELFKQGQLSIDDVVSKSTAEKSLEGGTEMIWTPELNILNQEGRQIVKEYAKKVFLKEALSKSLIKQDLKYLLTSVVKNLVQTPVNESIEEIGGNLGQDVLINPYYTNKNVQYNPEQQSTLLNNIETAVITSLSMIPTSILGLSGDYSTRKSAIGLSNYEIGKNSNEYLKYAVEGINKLNNEQFSKIYPQFSSKEEAVKSATNLYNLYTKSFEVASPTLINLPLEGQKNDYYNTVLEINKRTPSNITSENDIKEVMELQLKKAKYESLATEFKNKPIREQLSSVLSSKIEELDFETINVPDLSLVAVQLNDWKNIFGNDTKYKKDIELLDEKLDYVNKRITNLKPVNPQQQAIVNNEKGAISIQRNALDVANLKFNTPYYLSTIEDVSVEGDKIKKRPLITILQDNGDGTIKISSEEELIDIPLEELSKYKFTEKATVDNWRKNKSPEAFVFDHENDVFSYEFGKSTDNRDKTVKGRIQYNPLNKTIEFVYKDKKGNIQKYTLSKSDLKDITKGKLKYVKTLETESEFSAKQSKMQESASKTDFEQLQSLRRWDFIKSFVDKKQEELKNTKILISKVEDELLNTEIEMEKLQKQLDQKESTITKKGTRRVDVQKLFNKLNILQNQHKQLSNLIDEYNRRKEDLENQIEYTKQYEGVDFDSQKSLVDQLVEDQFNLELQLEQVDNVIDKLKSLVKGIESTIKNIAKTISNLVKGFESKYGVDKTTSYDPTLISDLVEIEKLLSKEYPDYTSFLEKNPEYLKNLNKFNELINDNIDKVELLERDISNLKSSIKANIDVAKKIQDKIRYQEELITDAQKSQKQFDENKNIAKIQSIAEQIFQSQDKTQTNNQVLETEEDEKLITEESDKIDISDFFSTTTSGITREKGLNLNSPQVLRLQKFLNSVENIFNYSLLAITKDNAKNYGLEDILYTDEKTTNNTDDENDNDIVLVVVLKDNLGKISFVDENGNILNTPTKDTVVQTSLRKASLKWSDGEKAYSNKLNQSEEDENKLVNELEETHKKLRQDIVNAVKAGSTALFGIKYISRGRSTQEGQSNPVSVLIPNVNLANQQIIQIPQAKEGKSAPVTYMGNKAISMPIGRPILSHNQFFEFLNNRKFSQQDINKFVKIFKALYDAYKEGNKENISILSRYLQKTLYFREPSKVSKTTNTVQDTPIGRSQIWFSYDNNTLFINFSENYRIPFNLEQGNINAFNTIEAFFQGKENKGVYHNIDDKGLIGEVFIEVVNVSKEGKLETREWKSYQEYLLSDKYPNGTNRPTEEIPLTVKINPSTETTPNKAGRYIIFDNKSNQSVVSQAKEQVVQTKKENIQQPVVKIDENTQFDETILPTQDFTKLEPGKFYRMKFINNGEEKTVDFTLNDKKFVTVISSNLAVDFKTIASNINERVTGKTPKSNTTVLYELSPLKQTQSFEPINSLSTSNEWASITSTTPVEPIKENIDGIEVITNLQEILGLFTPSENKDDTNYRQATKTKYKLENLKAAKEWFEERFPQIEFRLAFGLIDGKAWGRLKDKIVTLSDVAEEGTIYHEAFEVVHKYILKPIQLKSLYKEFKNRKGSFIDYETGKLVEYSKASNYQIKEQLAEEYREYELTGKKWKGEYHKNSLFRKIEDFINFILNGLKNPESIQEIFDKISEGAYKDFALPVETQNLQSEYKLSDIKKTNPVFFNDVMKSMTNLMFDVLQSQNKSIPEILLNNYDIEAEQALIKNKIDSFYGGNAAITITEKFTKESFVNTFKSIDNFKSLMSKLSEATPVLYSNLQSYAKDKTLSQDDYLEKLYDLFNNYKYINDNWDEIKKAHRDYLAKYSIEFKEDDNESTEEVNTNENKNQNDYLKDVLKLSRKVNANTEIKLLIATLREMEFVKSDKPFFVQDDTKNKKPVLNTLMMSNLVDYNKTIVSLLYKLSPATTFDEMIDLLKQEAVYNPSLDQLLNKLKLNTPTNQLSEFDVDLRNKFFTSLNNMAVKYKKLILDPQTKLGLPVDLNEENAFNIIKTKWFNATRANNKLFKVNKEGRFTINKSSLPIDTIRTLDDVTSFLNSLGYEYNIDLNRLNSDEKEQLLKSALNLFKVITTNDPELIMYNSPLVRENLNNLAELYLKYTDNYSEPQHLNIEREPVQNIILHNFIGSIAKTFNISKTFEDFITRIPQLNPNSKNNTWLSFSQVLSPNSEFFKDGKRTKKLSIEIIEGSETRESGKGIPTSKLSIVDRVAQEFAFNLQGLYYILTPADTKTEWGINFGHFVTQSQSKDNTYIVNLFKKYLECEILTVQQGNPQKLQNVEKVKNKLRFFHDILENVDLDLTKTPSEAIAEKEKEVTKAILDWIDSDVVNTYDSFTKDGIIIPFIKGQEDELSYSPIEETDSTNKLAILFAPPSYIKEGLTEQEVKDLIKFNNLNYIFNIFEQHKLFWGDPAQWKDITKRIKSFTSGRNLSVNSASYFNDFYNVKDNTLSYINEEGIPETIELEPGDFGHVYYDDSIKTVTYEDVTTVNSSLDGYDNTNEADAQGHSFPLGTREIRRRSNTWSQADQEQFEWDNALCRKDNNLYPTGEKGKKLREYDNYIISKGNPFLQKSVNREETPVNNVLKPIYTGFKDGQTATVNLDKLSLAPLTWRLVKGTQAEQFYLEHFKRGTTYIKFESANKVGTTKPTPLYTKEGKLNNNFEHEKLDFKYFGIQVETKTQKNKTTLGTQLTKLITMNLDKIKNKLLVENNSRFLSALKTLSKQSIFAEFGIKESTVNGKKVFEFENFETIEKLIQKELNSRGATENLKDALKVNPLTGKFYLKWDLVIGSEKLESIITSIIDNNILRPKMFGGQMPQIASTLFERNPRIVSKIINGKPVLTSNELKFYEDKDGKRYCEVYLPFYMQEYISKGVELSISDIPDDLKFGVGFRIPTQNTNSIENFKIKGFLPVEYGNSIVVPSEITTKAGSDFDIDKLNIYLYNHYVNLKTGKPEKIKFLDDSNSTLVERYDRYKRRNPKIQQIYQEFAEKIKSVDKSIQKSWEIQTGQLNKLIGQKQLSEKQLEDLFYAKREKEIQLAFEKADVKESELLLKELENGYEIDPVSTQLLAEIAGLNGDIFSNLTQLSLELEENENKVLQTEEELESINNKIKTLSVDKIKKADIQAKVSKRINRQEEYIAQKQELFKQRTEQINQLVPDISFEEFEKLPIELQNSKKAVENAYIDNIRNILELPEMFEYLIKPNSAEELKQQAKEINSLYGENKESKKSDYYLSRLNNAKDRHAFCVGNDAVGIGASQQTQNAIGQLVDLGFTEDKEKFNLNFPTNSQDLGDNKIKYNLSNKVDAVGKTISDTISMFIDAFVDIAKDPYIFDLNGNLDTASIYITGIRMGIPLPLLTRWFNQPVIREYIKLYQQNKSISTELSGAKLTKKEMIAKLTSNFKLGEIKDRNTNFTEKELNDYIKEYVKDSNNTSQEFKDAQAILLKQFIQLQDLSWDLFIFGQAINLDTSRTVSFESIRIKMAKVATALEGRFASYVRDVYKDLFIGTIYNAKLELLESIKPLYLTESTQARNVLNPILNNIYNSIKKQDVLEEEARKLRKHFITYLLQTVPIKIGNQQQPTYLTSYINELLLSDKNIAIRLRNLQNMQEEGRFLSNFLTKNLLGVIPSFVKGKQKTHNIRPLRKMSDKIDSDLATSDFLNLVNHPQTENFLYDLIRTSLLQSGLNQDPFSISQLIPNDVFQDIANQINAYFENSDIDKLLEGFVNSYYQNQWYNQDLIPKATLKKTTIDKNTGRQKDRLVQWIPAESGYKPFLEYFVESDTSEAPVFSREAKNPYLLVKTLKKDIDGVSNLYTSYQREQMAKKGDYSFLETTLYKRFEVKNPQTGKMDIPLAKKHYFKNRDTGLDVYGYIILFYPVDAYGERFNLVEHYSDNQPSKINENQKRIKDPAKLYDFLKEQGKMSDRFVFQHIFPNLQQDNEDFITILDETLNSENPTEEDWTEKNNNCGI